MEARPAAKNSFQQQWQTLLPRSVIATTGRVPVPQSLRYLSESRLNPSKDLVTVVFTLSEEASEEERKTWDEFVEFHLNKEYVEPVALQPIANCPSGQ